MKKFRNTVFLCSLAIFIISLNITAQVVNCSENYEVPALRLGVVGGINLPFVSLVKKYSAYEIAFLGNYSFEKSAGYQFGLNVEKTLSKKFSLKLDAVVTQILFKYSVAARHFLNYSYNQSLAYFEIPVIVKYYITNGHFKPYLQGGLVGRISLNNIEKSNSYGKYWFTKSSNSEKILTTFMTDFEQAGLVLGGGICYDMKKEYLFLDFRYYYNLKNSREVSTFDKLVSFNDISPNEKFHYTDDISLISMKNIQFSIGFMYNLRYKDY